MLNKKDPLIESVQKIMVENEIRRQVTKNLNEELGIQSIKNLPHEQHARYNAILEQNINAALLESAPRNEKEASLAKKYGNPNELTKGDVLAGRGVIKGKTMSEGQDPNGNDTTSPSSMGIKKPDYAPSDATPDYAKPKEQTVNRSAKTSLPPGTVKEEQKLDEVAPPGREDQVKELKKKFPKKSAFAIAWASYNKKKGK